MIECIKEKSIKLKEFLTKKWWILPVTVNAAFLLLSALLFVIFLCVNWKCILNPELSKGYSCGTPFGDGGDKFFFGISASYLILFYLVIFNFAETIIIPQNSNKAQKIFMEFFAVLLLLDILTLGRVSHTAALLTAIAIIIGSYSASEFLKSINIPLYCTVITACLTTLSIFTVLIIKKKRIALPLAFFVVELFALCAFEMFNCYLYLD